MPINAADMSETQNATSFLQNNYFQINTGIESIVPSISNMTTCNNSSTCPVLTIQVQPVDKFRYRYKSEKGSHGSITGISKPKSKKTFPTVKLENFHTYKDVLVKVSLWTDEEIPRLHVLDLGGKDVQDGVCLKNDFTAQFKSIAIETKKKDAVCDVLRSRKIEFSGTSCDMNIIESEVQKEAKNINLNSSRLCFEAFYKNVPLCKVFSNPIYNLKSILAGDLRIVRLGKVYGQCSGGDEILMFCDKVKKEDVKVRFSERDENGETVWEDFGTFNPAVDVHHQVGIAFRTPQYKQNTEKVVYIDLYQPSDGKYGEGREFRYIPDENDLSRFSKKRKFPNPNEISTEAFNSLSPSVSSPEGGTSSGISDDSEDLNILAASDFPIECEPFFLQNGQFVPTNSAFDELFQLLDMDLEDDSHLTPDWAKNKSQSVMADVAVGQMAEVVVGQMADAITIKPSGSEVQRTDYQDIFKKLFGMKNNLWEKPHLRKHIQSLYSKTDKCGNTLLHTLLLKIDDIKFFTVIQERKLLSSIPEDLVNKKNEKGQTALELAVEKNNWIFLKQLLMQNGNPNIRNKEGSNCLHLASKFNSAQCMKALLTPEEKQKYFPDIKAFNFDGLTPLHLSVMHNSKECLKLLLQVNADVNVAETKCGRTSLHLAIEYQPALIPTLTSQPNIDLHAKDFRGYTPLQIACPLQEDDFEEILSQIENGSNSIVTYLSSLSEGLQNLQIEEVESTESKQSTKLIRNCELPIDLCLPNGNEPSADCLRPEVENELCHFLDTHSQWRQIGEVIGLDKELLDGIEVFSKRSSPSRTVLKKIKEDSKYPCVNAELIRNLLQAAQLDEATELFKQLTLNYGEERHF